MPFTVANVLFHYKRLLFCFLDLHAREVQVIRDSEVCTVLFSSKKKLLAGAHEVS